MNSRSLFYGFNRFEAQGRLRELWIRCAVARSLEQRRLRQPTVEVDKSKRAEERSRRKRAKERPGRRRWSERSGSSIPAYEMSTGEVKWEMR